MCTENQKIVKSDKVGWKICTIKRENGTVNSLYKMYAWHKGENVAKNDFLDVDEERFIQTGFHCFKYKKDAINFVKRFSSHGIKNFAGSTKDIILIRVVLKEYKGPDIEIKRKVRSGRNNVHNPSYDNSPCYVGPVAIWDGKYTKLT